MSVFDTIKLPPSRQTIRDLHGPMHRGVPSAAGQKASEQWSHGQLRYVVDGERRDELALLWGQERVADAQVAECSAGWPEPVLTPGPFCRGQFAMVRRGFEHVGCKAAHLGVLAPEHLSAWGTLGKALWDCVEAPRGLALMELIAGYGDELATLYADLDAMDRQLDALSPCSTWIFNVVPEHCHQLWPLRNVMRLAERQGILFREMGFTAYESEDSFVPELPIACLDKGIYGGGFDHDLFHFLLPTAPTDEGMVFETGMLILESAAQAYNSLVLASRHSGPAYDGHATWPGAQLFATLEEGLGIVELPRQIQAYAMLGWVCHPDFAGDRVDAWLQRLPRQAERPAASELIERNMRYVRHDTAWLKGIHPRYDAPVMRHLSMPLSDRFSDSLQTLLEGLDEVLWRLEDVDLRTYDMPEVGGAGAARQEGRRLWLKALELQYVLVHQDRGGTESQVLTSVRELRALDAAQLKHLNRWLALTEQAPTQRSKEELRILTQERRELDLRLEAARSALKKASEAVRKKQLRTELRGPQLPVDFVDSCVELFRGIEFSFPEHVGSDSPEAHC